MIGEVGIFIVLYEVGFIMIEIDFDFVVVGEMCNYLFEVIMKVIRYIINGVCFIVINLDVMGLSVDGVFFVIGVIVVFIMKVIGKEFYVVGKLNLMMFCLVLNKIGVYLKKIGMIGDCMDIDIVVGIEVGLYMVLVFMGISD